MNLLLTQCVQRDFVRPLAEGEPLPNLVHVGRLEAERLCGKTGALVEFLRQAHRVDPARLAIVHMVDRHDPAAHAAHLQQFRPHCLEGSDGARLLPPIDALAAERPNTALIPAGDLNDFEEQALRDALRRLFGGVPGEDVRIGVVGVWTDAKVSFLLYDLRTRLRASQLATCSALTASRSLQSHFRGLHSLSALLGVEVFHSPGGFLEWLVPGHPVAPPAPVARRAWLAGAQLPPAAGWGEGELVERDALLADFAASDAPLELRPLSGGFSGAQVFAARLPNGRAGVLKVGPRDEVARERFGNESIGRVLGDVVPRLLAWREGVRLAAMELELARSEEPGAGTPETFKAVCESDAAAGVDELLANTLVEVLERALGRLYRWGEKDNADLLHSYGFTDGRGAPQFGASVAARSEAIASQNGFASVRALLEDAALPGPLLEPRAFYERWLPGRSLTREVYPSAVHGDLNLANILLSRRPGAERPARVWIIDFARLARLPCLTDFAKVENDLAYILLPVDDAAALAGARALQQARLLSPVLELDLAPLARTPAERRHARLLGELRRIAARMDPRAEAAMADYRVALLRYAAHTLGFEQPSALQRRLALEACAQLAGGLASAA